MRHRTDILQRSLVRCYDRRNDIGTKSDLFVRNDQTRQAGSSPTMDLALLLPFGISTILHSVFPKRPTRMLVTLPHVEFGWPPTSVPRLEETRFRSRTQTALSLVNTPCKLTLGSTGQLTMT